MVGHLQASCLKLQHSGLAFHSASLGEQHSCLSLRSHSVFTIHTILLASCSVLGVPHPYEGVLQTRTKGRRVFFSTVIPKLLTISSLFPFILLLPLFRLHHRSRQFSSFCGSLPSLTRRGILPNVRFHADGGQGGTVGYVCVSYHGSLRSIVYEGICTHRL